MFKLYYSSKSNLIIYNIMYSVSVGCTLPQCNNMYQHPT